ncbi:unnamed protein product [Caenorhabditis auriculariae]|uniref:Nucleolar protein 14 n=1 Tax=Caenorhabditis auriculariae TaxID=2777116 RepID=A0A8S1GR67_9PELO|nr:unnamed protein product [Caenorhabditis auriculariae]
MKNTKKVGKKTKASGQPKKVNPFELKFNRSKHDVLGKKKLASVGVPTVSRKRAHEQREQTLGVEYARMGKVSKILDRRIGEKDDITSEEKTSMRFTEERIKNYKKASKFNLTDDYEGEEELLTHGGRALSDIEKYDKSMLSDDDDEDGNIGAEMVKIAHFGGGETSTEEKVQAKLSRKDAIAELISKTKVARQEKQAAKDELDVLTETLDEKYHRLMGRLQNTFRPVGATRNEVSNKDDYDKLALSLKIDADKCATPAERTKTEKEIAASERDRLELLEAQRLARMNTKARKSKKDADRFVVRFDKDGNMINSDKVEKPSIKKVAFDSDDELSEENDDEEEEEDLDDLLEKEDEEDDLEDEEEDEDDEDEEEEDDDDEVEVRGKIEKREKADVLDVGPAGAAAPGDDGVPFVFEMPKNYSKFIELLQKYPEDKMGIVLERLTKCHHPSLKEGNKKLLNKLFLMLLRLFDDMAKESLTEGVLNELSLIQRHLYGILKFDVQYATRCVRALIRQHWNIRKERQKNKPVSFSLVMVFRLVAALFPMSDIWHPACTPAMLLATSALSRARISDLRCLARQLFLATTIVDNLAESKRFLPEVVSFVTSALLLAVEDKPFSFTSFGFPISKPHCDLLCVNEPPSAISTSPIPISIVFSEESDVEVDEPKLRLSVLRSLVALVQTLRVVYSTYDETFTILFTPIVKLLKLIKADHLPSDLKEELETVIASTEGECKAKSRVTQMSLVKTEKTMLRMLEPRFDEDFDPERPRKGRDTTRMGPKGEKKRLEQELKKERRGAIKELRKDTAFLARKQMTNVKAKDAERQKVTKRLMSGLQIQQGEWNKELRESGKKKINRETETALGLLKKQKKRCPKRDPTGMSTLSAAVYRGNLAVARRCLDLGCGINDRTYDSGYTPLMFGALSGKTEICKFLMDNGARPYLTNSIGKTASELAAFIGHHECVSVINNHITIDDIESFLRPKGGNEEEKFPDELAVFHPRPVQYS